ncbi:metal-dependent hydrolase [Pseudomonadales bacterium]|nr:metal-dependent hydrolase [Pseudomonadales bacterium]
MSQPHPMDNIVVRQLRFDFDQTESGSLWSQSSPEFSMFLNALGIHVPYFERFLVKVMRQYRSELTDPSLAIDVQAIIGQEAHHAFNFVRWNQVLCARYPELRRLEQDAESFFQTAFDARSKRFKVGFTAGYETFTFLGGMIILDRYEELMGDADPDLRALWVWHQVEEVEHGAVAFDFYRALYPDDQWYRRLMIVHAFLHISWQTFKAYRHMMNREGYYHSVRKAVTGWRFFFGFAWDLARSALPVFSRQYHPRTHPICNEQQNPVAVAWRDYVLAGGRPEHLDSQTSQHLSAP